MTNLTTKQKKAKERMSKLNDQIAYEKEMKKQGLKATRGLVCSYCNKNGWAVVDKWITDNEPICWSCLWEQELEAMEDSI